MKQFRPFTMLFIGLVAFLVCQPHFTFGDEHGSAAGTDESCQVWTMPSAAGSGPLLATPSQIPGHADSLSLSMAVLDVEEVFSPLLSGDTGPPVRPISSTKRYQLVCTYRL